MNSNQKRLQGTLYGTTLPSAMSDFESAHVTWVMFGGLTGDDSMEEST